MILSRTTSALALFAAACAAAWALGTLGLLVAHEAWKTPVTGPDPQIAGLRAPDATNTAPAPWPALFGTRSESDPAPEAAERIATEYTLSGIAIGGAQSWAMISDGETNALVQTGQTLSGGETVIEIAVDGVRIDRDGTVLLISLLETQGVERTASGTLRRTGSQLRSSFGIDEFRGRDMRQVLVRAGGVRMVETESGLTAQEILWVQPGQLYDRIGLQKGDKVLTINGISAGDAAALSAAVGDLLREREFTLEIQRGGRVRALKLTVHDDG